MKHLTHDNETYWRNIRKEMSQLDRESANADAEIRLYNPKHKFETLEASRKPIYLVATEVNRSGGYNVSACVPFNAAKMIVDGTHRLATPQEAETWLTQQAEQKRMLDQAESRKQQPLVTELVSALAGINEQQKRSSGKQSAS